MGQGLPPFPAPFPRSRVPPRLGFPAALPQPRSPRITTPGGTQGGGRRVERRRRNLLPAPPVPAHAAPRDRAAAEANRNSSHAPRASLRMDAGGGGGGRGHTGGPEQRGERGPTLGPIGDMAGGGGGCHRVPHSAMQRGGGGLGRGWTRSGGGGREVIFQI